MLEYSQVVLDQLVIHHIGSHSDAEDNLFSRSTVKFDDDNPVVDILNNYFFKSFKNEACFSFFHEDDLNNNVMYALATKVFNDASLFYDASVNIANHLYDISNHPMIKGGELYIAYFRNCVIDGEVTDALGVFKSENKETYLKIYLKEQNFELGAENGINVKKLDKGCLIFKTEYELGYKVMSVDNINKGSEAQFWMNDFLRVKPREDNYYFTNNYLKLCRDFVGDVFNSDNDVPRADQIDMLNRSIDFFNKKNSFDEREFERDVIRQPEIVDAFNEYKNFFETEKELPLRSEFDISKSAVKDEKRNFKSILKLDKNFHVYVHGKRNYLEKGFDSQKGLNYYKLYFEVEH
ncbi:MAG: nucleoid-associated protein [Marinilabiliaceae bacterium]|nr:nucleoid-associated protein [Marinilabiliaceae bacterium]